MKNNYSKILLAVVLVTMIICNACMTAKKQAELARNKPLMETYWQLKTIQGKPVGESPVCPSIIFHANGKYDGKLGCNSYFGTYYARDNRHIRMNYEGATKRLCNSMTVEKEFMMNLHSDFRTYEIHRDTLILKDNKKNQILMFIAAEKTKSSAQENTSEMKEESASSDEIILTPKEDRIGKSFAHRKGKLPWPVDEGEKVGDFGSQSHSDVPSVMVENRGIDIKVEPYAIVKSVFKGRVAGVSEVMGSKVLMLRHGKYLTVYQNMDNICVKKGDFVKKKQIVGIVGKTPTNGDTYKLHFEIWDNNNYLDPSQWILKK